MGSGYVYESIFATGRVRVLVTGNVPYVGGASIAVNPYPFTGSGMAYNQNNSGFIATGIVDGYYPNLTVLVYTGELTGIILNSGQYSGKDFTIDPAKDSAPVFSAPYILEATGYESGIGPSGKINPEFFTNFEAGYYSFNKSFSGIEGRIKLSDNIELITGYLGIVECVTSEKRKYVGISQEVFGDVSSSVYLSSCDTDTFIPSGFVATGKSNVAAKLYVLTGECEETGNLDEDLPKFIVIRPTGVYELETRNLEVGTNLPFSQQNFFLNNNTGVRTKIFGAGSGYFENVVGDCQNLGRWDHLFSANEISVEKNVSDYIFNNINFNMITLEDNGLNYFSDVYFKSTGILEKFNFKLNTTNKPIQKSPARDIFYRLILSKKISDTAYSGFYESDFLKISNTIDFCTGLSQGDYRVKLKYINRNISPTGTPICRIPIQIVNIVDKNYYNKNNIDIFTGQLSDDFDTFRFRGSGYHHQANVFYTKDEIYGTQFLTTTGYTQKYLTDLYRAPLQTYGNFNTLYNNSIIKAIQYSINQLTGWLDSGIRNINIVTNHIALSGFNKNQFLDYIKDIYTNRRTIFNVLNCSNVNRNNDNFQSFDTMDEFLKDIATIGGGTYYNCSNNFKSNVDSYIGYNGLVPLNYQPVFATCNGFYPTGSQFDNTTGQEGIDIIPIPQVLPPIISPIIPVVVDPVIVEVIPDEVEVPIVITTPGPDITPPEEKKLEPQQISYGGGGSSSSNGDGTKEKKEPKATCDKRNGKLQVTITSASYTKKARHKSTGGEDPTCVCQTPGVITIEGTIENPNCIGQRVSISASARLIVNGKLEIKGGQDEVDVLGKDGEEVPKEGTNFKPFEKPKVKDFEPTKRPESKGGFTDKDFIQDPGSQFKNFETDRININKPQKQEQIFQDSKTTTKEPLNSRVNNPNVEGLKSTQKPNVPGPTEGGRPSVQGLNPSSRPTF